jgi:4'-phosphopantetheinyl transferase
VTLSDTQIDVWLLFDEQRDDERRRDCAILLPPDEIERARRYLHEPQRQQFVLTRALTRTALSHYVPEVAPAEWRFVAGSHGKPALAAPFVAHGIHFNAAHTAGLVVLAVARAPHIGVDVENFVAGRVPLAVAARYFDAAEVRDLEALPAGEQRRRFYALWTLKESWVKATGHGLTAGLGAVSFSLDAAHRARQVKFATDPAGPWNFWQAQVSAEHLLAIAIHSSWAVDWDVRLWRCLPGAPQGRAALPAPRPLGDSVALLGQEERCQA